MGKAIKDLMHEHEAIKSGLNILETMVDKLSKGVDVEKTDLNDMLNFLKDFADKCHHGKEEQYLFEYLVNAGMSKEKGPVAVMLQEHNMGRSLIREMTESLNALPIDKNAFIGSAGKYITLLRAHIEKENKVLFIMADDRLDEKTQAEIYEKFEKYEAEVMGLDKHEELHKLLNSLAKKYPV